MTRPSAKSVVIERRPDAPAGHSDFVVIGGVSFIHAFMCRMMTEFDPVLTVKILEIQKSSSFEQDAEVCIVMRFRFQCNISLRSLKDAATLVKLEMSI